MLKSTKKSTIFVKSMNRLVKCGVDEPMNMNSKKAMAVMILLTLVLSGCTGIADEPVDVPDVELPSDWSTIVARSSSSPQLSGYTDCDDLEESLKSSIAEEYRIQLLQAVEEVYYYGGWFGGEVMEDAEMAMDGASTGASDDATRSTPPPRTEGEDYSGTNNQEEGVDEADFVKTDGYYIYFLNGKNLEIMGVPEFGELTHESTSEIEGSPVAMMLDGDQLVTISTVSSWNIPQDDPLYDYLGWSSEWRYWRSSTLTKFTVLDISNRSEPTVDRELFIEGSYLTAREVNATVRTVTHTWMDIPGVKNYLEYPTGYWNLDYDSPLRREIREKVAYETILANQEALDALELEDIIPRVYERENGIITSHSMSDGDCRDFVAPEDGFNRGFTSIFTLDLASENFDFEADHIIGNWPMVYASQDVLVITENAWDWWWFWGNDGMQEMTNIHTFDISREGETFYTGSGRVDGQILNQFSISEYEGILRVASTVGQWGRWWMENPEPMSSQVVTLERAVDVETGSQILREVGKVDGIAEDERIWSARFVEDMAYIVTFEQIDPLWTIDLSDPTQPTILGELEVPGVSTYIHPLSEDALLTIGIGPRNADGTGLDWSNTRISMFNVSDPTTPSLSDVLSLSPVDDPDDQAWVWAYSEATYEHKAFQYWGPKEMLAIPLSTYRYNQWQVDGKWYWNYNFISKLILVNVDEDTGNLSVHGTVDHSDFYNRDDARYYWSEYNIRRSIFMGDYVYAISSGGVTATNLSTLEESASVELDLPVYNYYYDDVAVAETDDEESTSSSGSDGEATEEAASDDGY